MTQYVGCDQARPLLEGLVDGELSMAEQLAVESHLRWCRTCTLRVQDMRLIGASLRRGMTGNGPRPAEDPVLASVNEAVLMRVRAEREQSFAFRLREMFSDMRLLWPALGATAAVAVCVSVAATVLQASNATKPQSLAALIETLAQPGSENNPLRPANTRDPLRDGRFGVSMPRPYADDAKRAGGMLDAIPHEDLIYTIRTVVGRDGRITNFELLLNDEPLGAEHVRHRRAVLDAVQQSRFAPAQTPLGRAVAVDMVWVIAKTTAVVAPQAAAVPAVAAPEPAASQPAPAAEEPAVPVDQRSGTFKGAARLSPTV